MYTISRHFSETNKKAIDEIWYKRAIDQHNIEPESFVFSVPFNSGYINYFYSAKNIPIVIFGFFSNTFYLIYLVLFEIQPFIQIGTFILFAHFFRHILIRVNFLFLLFLHCFKITLFRSHWKLRIRSDLR